jgi:hypothetical protein
MNKALLLMTLFGTIYAGCSQRHSHGKTANKLNFILLGNDSIACYYGNSDDITDLKQGSLSNTTFVQTLMKTAKQHAMDGALALVIKPTASTNVGDDFKSLVDQLNINDLQGRSLDTLDETERKMFNRISLQDVMDRPQPTSYHFQLPKDEPNQKDSATGPVADRLIVFIYGDSGIYAYRGADLHSGKKYTRAQLGSLLVANKSNPKFFVSIRPAASSTYKSTVNMLDEMTIAGIKHYNLVDISKDQEGFITDIQNK